MKTEFERISEIMYTLLEHQPVIDVPYEKINDIAVALVKEVMAKYRSMKPKEKCLEVKSKCLNNASIISMLRLSG